MGVESVIFCAHLTEHISPSARPHALQHYSYADGVCVWCAEVRRCGSRAAQPWQKGILLCDVCVRALRERASAGNSPYFPRANTARAHQRRMVFLCKFQGRCEHPANSDYFAKLTQIPRRMHTYYLRVDSPRVYRIPFEAAPDVGGGCLHANAIFMYTCGKMCSPFLSSVFTRYVMKIIKFTIVFLFFC